MIKAGFLFPTQDHLLHKVCKTNRKLTRLYKIWWIGLPNSSNGMNSHLLFYSICYSMAVIQIKSVYDFIKLAWSLLKSHYHIKVKPGYKQKGGKWHFEPPLMDWIPPRPLKIHYLAAQIVFYCEFCLTCARKVSYFHKCENGSKSACWLGDWGETWDYLDEVNYQV